MAIEKKLSYVTIYTILRSTKGINHAGVARVLGRPVGNKETPQSYRKNEAWSDCDHSYVYKHDEKKSHSALEEMSKILCQLTNVSNDFGDSMREIFEQESMLDIGNGNWKTSKEWLELCDEALMRIENAHSELQRFRNHLFLSGGKEDETNSK